MAQFSFHSSWRVAATPAAVYAALAEVEGYPVWWSSVRSVRRIDDDRGELTIRSRLPYTLRMVATRAIEDSDRLHLRATLSGDLVGFSSWQIEPDGTGALAHFDEAVDTTGWLRRLPRPVRPLLEWNHAVMMRAGEDGLRRYLESSS